MGGTFRCLPSLPPSLAPSFQGESELEGGSIGNHLVDALQKRFNVALRPREEMLVRLELLSHLLFAHHRGDLVAIVTTGVLQLLSQIVDEMRVKHRRIFLDLVAKNTQVMCTIIRATTNFYRETLDGFVEIGLQKKLYCLFSPSTASNAFWVTSRGIYSMACLNK